MPECPDCPGRDHLAAVESREATPEKPPPLACPTCGSLNTTWIGEPSKGTLCLGCGRTWGT